MGYRAAVPRGIPSPHTATLRGSVFSALAARIATYQGEVYPFHVGDTWLTPPAGCRLEDLGEAAHPGVHRYAPPRGLPVFIDAILEHTRALAGVAIERGQVLVAAGATGALSALCGALLDPGDEVLVLSPHWPLIDGIVRSWRGVPVAVPFQGVAHDQQSAVALVEARRNERTIALYFGWPNNPTGAVIPPDWIAALAGWARRNDLWLITDEVYELLVYRGEARNPLALAPERTFSVHSLSKAFGLAGTRCGWVVGPAPVLAEAEKLATYTFYSTTTAAQLAGVRLLSGAREPWMSQTRALYRALGDEAAALLGLPAPAGGTFLFLDVGAHLGERGLLGFLERCAERGLFLAPGPSFGPYPNHVRLCYTSTPPEVTRRGLRVFAELIGRGGPALER